MQAILDFDCTLTEAMVYDNLGGGSLERARQMRLQWWLEQFGGKERLQMLEDFLARLERQNVSVHLCSHNNTEVIKEALKRVNLARFFVDSAGRFRIIASPGVDKARRIQLHLDRTRANVEEVIFIDDSAENCQSVSKAFPGLRVHHCQTATGITSHDCQLILQFFSKPSRKQGEHAVRASSPVASPRSATIRRVLSTTQCEEQASLQGAMTPGPSRRSFASSVPAASSPHTRMLSAPNPRITLATADPARLPQEASASVRCLPKVRASITTRRSLSPVPVQAFAVQHASVQNQPSLALRRDSKGSCPPGDSRAIVHVSTHHEIPVSYAPPLRATCTKMTSPPPSARCRKSATQRLGGA